MNFQRLLHHLGLLLLCFSTNGCALLVCDFVGLCHVLPRGTASEAGEVLMAPGGLTGEVLSGSAISLSWTDLSNVESGYAIDRDFEGTGWTTVTTTSANATGFLDSALTPGGIYTYRVRAVRDQETSDPSASVELIPTPLSGTPTAFVAVGQVSGVTAFNQVRVGWGDAASGETSFQVQRSLNGSTGWTTVGTATANATDYLDTTVTPDVAYYYRARAVFSGGYSAYVAAGPATSSTANGSFRKAEGPDLAGMSIAVSATHAYLGGFFTAFGSKHSPYLAAIGSNGSADSSFSTGTGFNSWINSVVLQGDGKLLVGGTFTSFNGTALRYVARLNADGSRDTSFNLTGTGFNALVNALAVQSDGKILVGGSFNSYDGTSRPRIARLNADGTLDPGFVHTGSGLNNLVNAIAVQLDGKVLVAGTFTSYNAISRTYVARLNADGSLDMGFALTGLGFNNPVNALALQSDGKPVVGGTFTLYNGTTVGRSARLNADGSLDATFTPGAGFDNTVNAIAIDPGSGELYFGGSFTSYKGAGAPPLLRLNSDASLDTDFNPVFVGLPIQGVALAGDGSGDVFATGTFTSVGGLAIENFVRLNGDGSVDAANVVGRGFDNTLASVAPLYDGSGDVYIGGGFTSYNGAAGLGALVRLTPTGIRNTTFVSQGFGGGNALALASVPDVSGAVYVGGDFTTYNALGANRIVRLLASGSRDPTFVFGSGFSGSVSSLAIADDGSNDLYAAGVFTSYNGGGGARIARINSDGSLDASFAVAGGFDLGTILVRSARDGTGSVYAWGGATSYNGTTIPANVPVRINANGGLDPGFTLTPLVATTNEISPTIGGSKAYIGGTFSAGGVLPNNYLVRINADGSVDSSFVQGSGLDAAVARVLPLSDGDVLVVGLFTDYNGTAVNGVARLNADGSLDTGFAKGVGSIGLPNALMEVRDGSRDIYLGGAFVAFLGAKVQRFLRLGANGAVE